MHRAAENYADESTAGFRRNSGQEQRKYTTCFQDFYDSAFLIKRPVVFIHEVSGYSIQVTPFFKLFADLFTKVDVFLNAPRFYYGFKQPAQKPVKEYQLRRAQKTSDAQQVESSNASPFKRRDYDPINIERCYTNGAKHGPKFDESANSCF